MYDRGLGVLEQYGLTAETVLRGRGALICQTEKDGKVSANIGAPPGGWSSREKYRNAARRPGSYWWIRWRKIWKDRWSLREKTGFPM